MFLRHHIHHENSVVKELNLYHDTQSASRNHFPLTDEAANVFLHEEILR